MTFGVSWRRLRQIGPQIRRNVARDALQPNRLKHTPQAVGAGHIGAEIVLSCRAGREFGLKPLQLDGKSASAPDQAALGLRNGVGAALIGNMQRNDIAQPTRPGTAAIATINEKPLAVRDGGMLPRSTADECGTNIAAADALNLGFADLVQIGLEICTAVALALPQTQIN